jgi:hypothetical protein
MLWIPAGFAFGTTSMSVLRVKFTGFSTRPCAYSVAGMEVLADANTSAGAPLAICVASAFEPANEYVLPGASSHAREPPRHPDSRTRARRR